MAGDGSAQAFSLDISNWVEKVNARADLVVRMVAMRLFTRIVMMSPVDTGRFRGNWQCEIGKANTHFDWEHYDKDGTRTIARIAQIVNSAKAGDTIYLSNNLAYALPLEYGHSRQAPAGMVRVSIQEMQAFIQQAKQQAKKEIP